MEQGRVARRQGSRCRRFCRHPRDGTAAHGCAAGIRRSPQALHRQRPYDRGRQGYRRSALRPVSRRRDGQLLHSRRPRLLQHSALLRQCPRRRRRSQYVGISLRRRTRRRDDQNADLVCRPRQSADLLARNTRCGRCRAGMAGCPRSGNRHQARRRPHRVPRQPGDAYAGQRRYRRSQCGGCDTVELAYMGNLLQVGRYGRSADALQRCRRRQGLPLLAVQSRLLRSPQGRFGTQHQTALHVYPARRNEEDRRDRQGFPAARDHRVNGRRQHLLPVGTQGPDAARHLQSAGCCRGRRGHALQHDKQALLQGRLRVLPRRVGRYAGRWYT